jgi:hypothetical protein
MSKHYPLQFILDDGVHVEVNKIANSTYDFILTRKGATEKTFTYVDDDRSKEEIINSLDFDQLNAVRRFWLERESVE